MIRGVRIQVPLLAGVSVVADDGPILNAGLVALRFSEDWSCIARKPYIFVIFLGEGFRTPCPSLDLRMGGHTTLLEIVKMFTILEKSKGF